MLNRDIVGHVARVLVPHKVVEEAHNGMLSFDGEFGGGFDTGWDGDRFELGGSCGVFGVPGERFEEEVKSVEAFCHHGVAPCIQCLLFEVWVVLEHPQFLVNVGHRRNHLRRVTHPPSVIW